MISLQHKAQLYGQLHAGLKAGLPVPQLVLPGILPAAFSRHAARLASDLQRGKTLSAALLGAKIIEPWECRLLAIGEGSGRLDSVVADLALFYETRHKQFGEFRSKLIYPFMVLLVAVLVRPLPEVVAGTLDETSYFSATAGFLLLAWVAYKLAVVRTFQQAKGGAFSPLLIRSLKFVSIQHWLRLLQEVSYLNLLTLCLESGVDAVETLKLLRASAADPAYRRRHDQAIRQVDKFGLGLAQALNTAGIIRNPEVSSFLHTAEQSGTLHSELRQYLIRRQAENAAELKYRLKKLSQWLYALVMLYVVAGFL